MKYKAMKILLIIAVLLSITSIYAQAPTAIIDFEGKGISQTDASALTDRLRSELFNLGFLVMERGLMEEILQEQGFQQTGCTSDECVVEVGKIVGVLQMVGGSISKVGNVFSISARIVDVETAEILQMVTYDYEGEIGELLKVGMKNVAIMLTKEKIEVPPVVGALGTIYITSNPSGASVWIDDVKIDGVTPLLVERQRVGEHKINVEKGNLSALSVEQIQANVVNRVDLTLGIAKGSINVFSIPLEAVVFIDGYKVGVTPLTIDELKVGEHEIEIEKMDYVPYVEDFEVRRNEIVRIEVRLEKMSLLSVLSVPSGALVNIDEMYVGTTPIRKMKLNPGRYDIRISKVNYEKYITVVELAAGTEEEISYDLIRKTGSLDITTIPSSAAIFLNGKMKGKSPLTLQEIPTGSYQIKAVMDGYLPFEKTVDLKYKKSGKVEMSLTSIASVRNEIQSISKKRNLWAGLAFASSVVGSYFKYSSYAHYQDYKTATTDAGKLHETIDRENNIYPVAFGVGVVCALPMIYHHWNKEKMEKTLPTDGE